MFCQENAANGDFWCDFTVDFGEKSPINRNQNTFPSALSPNFRNLCATDQYLPLYANITRRENNFKRNNQL